MRDPNRLCLGCMNEWGDSARPCPVCGFVRDGYEKPPRWLPLKHVLNKKYMIGKAIGEGGFGITYLGWDLNLQVRVAVKEYFPMGLATRETGAGRGNTITALSGARQESYRQGLEKFMAEARNLSKFYQLQGIVAVKDFFFENDTAYMVMEYVDGITLGAYLKERGGQLGEQEVLQLFHPVMESLKVVHQAGIVHRDISPDNIMMTKDGRMKLIDFGAARFAGGDTERSLTIILKHGYAPAEQYQSHGNQGPWTDVYAICATMYRMITGKVPPGAMDRLHEDTLEEFSALGFQVSERTAYVILDRGMAIKVENRCRSMEELMEALYGAGKFRRQRGKRMLPVILGVSVAGALCLGIGAYLIAGQMAGDISDGQGAIGAGAQVSPGQPQGGSDSGDTYGSGGQDPAKLPARKEAEPVSPEELAALQQEAAEAAGRLQAGAYHLISLRDDGTVAASGMNRYGNLNVGKWSGIRSVCAGPGHTVGVREDGSAVAAGDTSEGKCAVDTWKGLVKAAAGENHTLGLREDGTVVAAGANTQNQCNVSDWSGIRDVAAGGNHSLGLRQDGTVVAAGDDAQGQCRTAEWTDIVQIAARGNVSAGLKADGSIVIAGDSGAFEDALSWKQVTAISLSEGYLAGILSDRTVVVAGSSIVSRDRVASWEGIEAIAAADETLFGRKADGSIVRTTYEYGNAAREELRGLKKAVSGGGYLAGLKNDGTVLVWGLAGEDFGQAAVSGWSGIQDVAACRDAVFGVREDGTVQVIGQGYEEVSHWTGIQRIEACDGIVLGLGTDGKVRAAGANARELEISSWENVRAISAGDRGTVVAVLDDGSIVGSGREFMYGEPHTESISSAKSVACGMYHAVIVLEDGTVKVSTISARNNGGYGNVYSWRDVVQAAAGAEHTVGLKSDGTVLAAGSNANGQCEVSGWRDVVCVAAGEYYTLGIQSDGTLLVAGKLPGEF